MTKTNTYHDKHAPMRYFHQLATHHHNLTQISDKAKILTKCTEIQDQPKKAMRKYDL